MTGLTQTTLYHRIFHKIRNKYTIRARAEHQTQHSEHSSQVKREL